ncbi:hypothetical protein K402DRAFT_377497 [Aulographum hederae CBS 113979]|uniref:RBR-type E3 ubiquitin transferase n=1 Tax=Aulographum hederae CBS 113979 TaxID=1176131 RepID=A0A6G1GZG3_9PEZI|nr:hypothetical protein K402DRAFT_377497 [Aulographum hederae CBS 113979]
MDSDEEPAPRKSNRKRKSSDEEVPAQPPVCPKVARPNLFTCRVCYDDKPRKEFTVYHSSAARRHLTEVPKRCVRHLCTSSRNTVGPICRECITSHLVASLQSMNATKVGCPDASCTNPSWNAFHIGVFLKGEDFNLYNTLMFEDYKATAASRGEMTFVCMSEECDCEGVVSKFLTQGYPNVVCFKCTQRWCVLCQVQWHEGKTCQAYKLEQGITDDVETELMKGLGADDARRCTRCQMIVVKVGGCDYIYCNNCKTVFDWKEAEPVTAVLDQLTRLPARPKFSLDDDNPTGCEEDNIVFKEDRRARITVARAEHDAWENQFQGQQSAVSTEDTEDSDRTEVVDDATRAMIERGTSWRLRTPRVP